MDAGPILVFAAAAIACLLLLALVVSSRRDGPMIRQQWTLPPAGGSFDAAPRRRIDLALGRELTGLLENGDRAGAVRLIRERAGVAEDEAEAMLARVESLWRRLES